MGTLQSHGQLTQVLDGDSQQCPLLQKLDSLWCGAGPRQIQAAEPASASNPWVGFLSWALSKPVSFVVLACHLPSPPTDAETTGVGKWALTIRLYSIHYLLLLYFIYYLEMQKPRIGCMCSLSCCDDLSWDQ